MQSGSDRRKNILKKVENCVCRDRQNAYGDAEDNFSDIARRWTLHLQRRNLLPSSNIITAADVAVMMCDLKIARLSAIMDHEDNWIDLAGYAVCGAGINEKELDNKARAIIGGCVSEYSHTFKRGDRVHYTGPDKRLTLKGTPATITDVNSKGILILTDTGFYITIPSPDVKRYLSPVTESPSDSN